MSVLALGLAGGLLGSGVAGTAIGFGDGLTWLADDSRGEVLQYSAASGTVERAWTVGRPGDPIRVAQSHGMAAIHNERTGEVFTVDLSGLHAVGVPTAGGHSRVLVAGGLMALVDGARNTITRIDPVRATEIGEAWHLPAAALVDAAADDDGTVWVAATDGTVHGVAWDEAAARFVGTRSERVHLIGDDAELTAHPRGVTVFGPRSGVIAQVGTPHEGYRRSDQLVGVRAAVASGPDDLVPGALPGRAAVVILDRGHVRHVSTGEFGCATPTNPVSFSDRVYVVCRGSQKIIQLTRDGREAGPQIHTPGDSDAMPVAAEDRLLLNVGGASRGIEIGRTGGVQPFDRLPAAGSQPAPVRSTGTVESQVGGTDGRPGSGTPTPVPEVSPGPASDAPPAPEPEPEPTSTSSAEPADPVDSVPGDRTTRADRTPRAAKTTRAAKTPRADRSSRADRTSRADRADRTPPGWARRPAHATANNPGPRDKSADRPGRRGD